MGLTIKNDETCRLVEKLATLTGQSTTAAITEAVRERLKRVRAAPDWPRVCLPSARTSRPG